LSRCSKVCRLNCLLDQLGQILLKWDRAHGINHLYGLHGPRLDTKLHVGRDMALQEGPRPMTRFRASLVAGLLLIGLAAPATAAPEGTMTWGVHITLASRWLDPAETEGIITPFMVLYGLHDALVKPMPEGINTPSLAESWTQSNDGLAYEFLLRKGIK